MGKPVYTDNEVLLLGILWLMLFITHVFAGGFLSSPFHILDETLGQTASFFVILMATMLISLLPQIQRSLKRRHHI